jgi:hypothetical protein
MQPPLRHGVLWCCSCPQLLQHLVVGPAGALEAWAGPLLAAWAAGSDLVLLSPGLRSHAAAVLVGAVVEAAVAAVAVGALLGLRTLAALWRTWLSLAAGADSTAAATRHHVRPTAMPHARDSAHHT